MKSDTGFVTRGLRAQQQPADQSADQPVDRLDDIQTRPHGAGLLTAAAVTRSHTSKFGHFFAEDSAMGWFWYFDLNTQGFFHHGNADAVADPSQKAESGGAQTRESVPARRPPNDPMRALAILTNR